MRLTYTNGVYAITHKESGKQYIGSTGIGFAKRWGSHRHYLRRGKHPNPKLQHAWTKYGEEAFEFTVLEVITDEKTLIPREQHWLDTAKPEYNLCLVAGSTRGRKQSAEHKRKIQEARKGFKHTEESKRRISEAQRGKAGHMQTDETRKKISESLRGHGISDETRAKMSAAKMGNRNNRFCKK